MKFAILVLLIVAVVFSCTGCYFCLHEYPFSSQGQVSQKLFHNGNWYLRVDIPCVNCGRLDTFNVKVDETSFHDIAKNSFVDVCYISWYRSSACLAYE